MCPVWLRLCCVIPLPEVWGLAHLKSLVLPLCCRAFTKFAYFKFNNVPLYLEWAPVGMLQKPKNSGVNLIFEPCVLWPLLRLWPSLWLWFSLWLLF